MSQPKQTPQALYQALNGYVDSYTLLTGKKPDFIPVTKKVREWYANEIERLGKDFGIWKATGTYPKADNLLKKELEFSGIELQEV